MRKKGHMGFRLTITLKTERTVLLLAGRPMAEWCEACGAECRRHQMEHCQHCADACEHCAEECRHMAGAAA